MPSRIPFHTFGIGVLGFSLDDMEYPGGRGNCECENRGTDTKTNSDTNPSQSLYLIELAFDKSEHVKKPPPHTHTESLL